jgi:hypothetical protein
MELPEESDGCDNLLFSFMLFVDGNGFDLDDIKDIYTSEHPRHLSTMLCLLNKGVIVYKKECSLSTGESWSSYSIHPKFSHEMNLTLQSGQW